MNTMLAAVGLVAVLLVGCAGQGEPAADEPGCGWFVDGEAGSELTGEWRAQAGCGLLPMGVDACQSKPVQAMPVTADRVQIMHRVDSSESCSASISAR